MARELTRVFDRLMVLHARDKALPPSLDAASRRYIRIFAGNFLSDESNAGFDKVAVRMMELALNAEMLSAAPRRETQAWEVIREALRAKAAAGKRGEAMTELRQRYPRFADRYQKALIDSAAAHATIHRMGKIICAAAPAVEEQDNERQMRAFGTLDTATILAAAARKKEHAAFFEAVGALSRVSRDYVAAQAEDFTEMQNIRDRLRRPEPRRRRLPSEPPGGGKN